MRIVLCYKIDVRAGHFVECYASSAARELRELGNDVTECGEGHTITALDQLECKDYDLLIEIENGRNSKGELNFQQHEHQWNIPSVVYLIDSHGHPDLHKRISSSYSYVFFAVWARRDLFVGHPHAYWLPSATDLKWFDWHNFADVGCKYDFGFFGSKGGLHRAKPLIDICVKNGWTFDVRQVTKARRPKWPQCGEAMAACYFLFNHSQKHDINQRVFESLAMCRPLLNDFDSESGIDKLFQPWKHFIPYESYTYRDLEERCKWIFNNSHESQKIAEQGYEEIVKQHTVKHRMQSIMERIGER
ncbi:MAG: glycosyltransferase [Halobacteriota archaeon]|nr:glycosyltransferase [Halobacteriota archaeon]